MHFLLTAQAEECLWGTVEQLSLYETTTMATESVLLLLHPFESKAYPESIPWRQFDMGLFSFGDQPLLLSLHKVIEIVTHGKSLVRG